MEQDIIPTPHEVTLRDILEVIPLELKNVSRNVLMCNYSEAIHRIKTAKDNLDSILFLIDLIEKENKGESHD